MQQECTTLVVRPAWARLRRKVQTIGLVTYMPEVVLAVACGWQEDPKIAG